MVCSFLTTTEFNTTKVQKKAETTSLTSVTKWKTIWKVRELKSASIFSTSPVHPFFYFNFARHIKHSIACKIYSNKMYVTIQDLLMVRI